MLLLLSRQIRCVACIVLVGCTEYMCEAAPGITSHYLHSPGLGTYSESSVVTFGREFCGMVETATKGLWKVRFYDSATLSSLTDLT